MRYFFIDYENTKNQGLEGIDKLNTKDKVFVFYSKNANKLSFEDLKIITASKAEISYIDIKNLGHNALDFNLVYFMGIKTGRFRGKNLKLHIISNDSGYDTLTKNPMISENIKISRSCNIKSALTKNDEKEEIINLTEQQKVINSILSKNKLQRYTNVVVDSIKLSPTKADLHNNLTKTIGKSVGVQIYRIIRPEFVKIKAL